MSVTVAIGSSDGSAGGSGCTGASPPARIAVAARGTARETIHRPRGRGPVNAGPRCCGGVVAFFNIDVRTGIHLHPDGEPSDFVTEYTGFVTCTDEETGEWS